MPELPEVETVRAALAPRIEGRRVLDAGSHPSSKFTPARQTTGRTLTGAGRRGKYLLLQFDDHTEQVIHLGMTGRLSFGAPPVDQADPYLRAWWRLSPTGDRRTDELLLFHDTRRFGRIRLVPAGDYRSIPTLARAGLEPWDPELTARRFHRTIQQSRRPIKTQLLSQRPVAGVGNIYADEALWAAEINPRARRIGAQRAARLLDEIRSSLERGLANGGTTLRDYRNVEGGEGQNQYALQAYGRAGQPCRRCGTPLTSASIDARTTVWCRVCQRR